MRKGMSKVVITGIGLVSALGNCKECFWGGMLNGPAPLRRVTRFETDPLDELYAAEVANFEPPIPVKPKQFWTSNRSIQFAISAAQRALADAGIATGESPRRDIGVVFGSSQSCIDIAVKVDTDAMTKGPRTVSPMLFPHANPSAPSCRVSLQFGLQAFNTILSNGPTSGLDAIHHAAEAVRDGLAPIVLAGGVEELTRMTFLFHHAMENLPSKPSESAGLGGGVVLGEGCGVLVLEDEQHAHARGANVLGEVAGYGSCFWPGDADAEDRLEAPEFAMRSALNSAEIQPDDVDVVFASANGHARGDRMECEVLRRVVPQVVVTKPKMRLGETHSAAGALHAAACLLAMDRGAIPIRSALINCFSTSRSIQNNSCLVLKSC
jgi:3-oxoacyl-[acyl-carrier-protein] synthase II